ncbi:MAG: putative rane protein [Phycisphaerales bacterium]|nr:putative rane protein [Phycisphaerales bacterium]
MFGKISYTWDLMGASWNVLRKDKALVLFPLFSGISCLVVMASFAVPALITGAWHPPARGAQPAQQIAYYGMLFAFYFCNYFVITFFNVGIIACAIERMQGGEPTFEFGIQAAASRLPLIIGWSLVSATVGLILRVIEDRSDKVGELVAGLLGMAWTIVTYLAVPVLVVERKGPFLAIKESGQLLRKTWGEQIVGNFSFGIVFFLLGIPALLLVVAGGYFAVIMQSVAAAVVFISLAVAYIVVLSLVQSALQAIFQAAVYLYARDRQAPAGFPVALLRGSMAQR